MFFAGGRCGGLNVINFLRRGLLRQGKSPELGIPDNIQFQRTGYATSDTESGLVFIKKKL